jgi:hypothetical protein
MDNQKTIVPDPEVIRKKLQALKIAPIARALKMSRQSLYNFSTGLTRDIKIEEFRQLVEYLKKEGHYEPTND